ncbi:MAG: hypothetical protein SGJ05_06015 [bacterium]|nr:hypothetical protein [bacterium]
MRGRYIEGTTKATSTNSLQWNAEHGLIIVVPTSNYKQSYGKTSANIISTPLFK